MKSYATYTKYFHGNFLDSTIIVSLVLYISMIEQGIVVSENWIIEIAMVMAQFNQYFA